MAGIDSCLRKLSDFLLHSLTASTTIGKRGVLIARVRLIFLNTKYFIWKVFFSIGVRSWLQLFSLAGLLAYKKIKRKRTVAVSNLGKWSRYPHPRSLRARPQNCVDHAIRNLTFLSWLLIRKICCIARLIQML